MLRWQWAAEKGETYKLEISGVRYNVNVCVPYWGDEEMDEVEADACAEVEVITWGDTVGLIDIYFDKTEEDTLSAHTVRTPGAVTVELSLLHAIQKYLNGGVGCT